MKAFKMPPPTAIPRQQGAQALVQARIPEEQMEMLKAHRVHIPDLIRQHIQDVCQILANQAPPPRPAKDARRRRAR